MTVEWNGVQAPGRPQPERWSPVRELRQSLFLLVLTASSLGAYIGLGVVAVRLFATR